MNPNVPITELISFFKNSFFLNNIKGFSLSSVFFITQVFSTYSKICKYISIWT